LRVGWTSALTLVVRARTEVLGLSVQLQDEGSLAEHDFPGLLQALSALRWTGRLTLTNKGIGKGVTVCDGNLVFASSSSVDDRLGELLLRKGRITLRQLADAGGAVGPGKRLGAILVESGVLTPKDLVKTVTEHAQEIIYSLFQWTEGHYRLQAGTDATTEAITLKMSTPDIIVEGIRRIDAWSRIDRAVGGLSARYARASDYEGIIARMSLTFEKLSILTGLHGEQSLERICEESTLNDYEVCRALWAFRVIGAVERVDIDTPESREVESDDDGLSSILAGE
jgi:hypothetical protein